MVKAFGVEGALLWVIGQGCQFILAVHPSGPPPQRQKLSLSTEPSGEQRWTVPGLLRGPVVASAATSVSNLGLGGGPGHGLSDVSRYSPIEDAGDDIVFVKFTR